MKQGSRVIESPCGPITISTSEVGLSSVSFGTVRDRDIADGSTGVITGLLDLAEAELTDYFAGTLREFTVPVAPDGSAFQQSVWALLRDIPFGNTRTYGGIALQLGDAKRARAVGLANGQNPIAIVIPCHRVIGKSGDLTGYAGGIKIKAALLAHEQRFANAAIGDQVELFSA